MKFLIGVVTILLCVFGVYSISGGSIIVLWQPGEAGIILGASIGAFIIANPSFAIRGVLKTLKVLLKGEPYGKEEYLQMLCFVSEILKTAKMKGILAIEADIDNPAESSVFKKYPTFLNDNHAVTYFCDYMRIINMGIENHYQIEDLMLQEKESHHKYHEAIVGAVTNMADGMPALGIVAAVLGVIKTMGHVADPPEVLGHLIGGALVGTFLGVLCAYAFIGPIAQYLGQYIQAQSNFINCIKTAIISHMQGNAPVISVEFARKVIQENLQPTFEEVEQRLNTHPEAEQQ